jgi:glycosyltransferase involved in cell wall biosynthesis
MHPATLSVIVPAWNAAAYLPLCLDAILASTYQPQEIILVDDGSNDSTCEVAHSRGVTVLKMGIQSGPGAARNYAAQTATGEILFFVDADVVIHPDAVERVIHNFQANPEISAVFGSYDKEPAEKNFLSQYKNLFHHYVHQKSSTDASTFWAGCGAVRRDVFLDAGGFDCRRYRRPSIEDIELGYRLNQKGHSIILDKQLLGKHLKRWTLRSLLHADVFCRAIPWARLILQTKKMAPDLNLKLYHRVSAVLAWLSLVLVLATFVQPKALPLAGLLGLIVLLLNRDFYFFFLRHAGTLFTIRVIPLHFMYYLYSSGAFAFCFLSHLLQWRSNDRATASRSDDGT